MLNDTIINAINTLTPIWSNQIVAAFDLRYEYNMIINMLIREFSNHFNISELYANYIIYTIIALMTIYYMEIKTGIKPFQNLKNFLGNLFGSTCRCSLTKFCRIRKHSISYSLTLKYNHYFFIDKFLYTHQTLIREYPNIEWIYPPSDKSDLREIFDLNSEYSCSTRTIPYLAPGIYNIIFPAEYNIQFKLTISDPDVSIRKYLLEFQSGTEQDLYLTLSKYKQTQPFTERVYDFPDNYFSISKVIRPKYNDAVWKGYYHPRLEQFKEWSKLVDGHTNSDKYTEYNQPRQMSIICWGQPGTGKSSLSMKLAEYTQRHIIHVDLLKLYELKSIQNLFIYPEMIISGANQFVSPNSCIYLLDEFDKTITKLNLITKKKQEMEKYKYDILAKSMSSYMNPLSSIMNPKTSMPSTTAPPPTTRSRTVSKGADESKELEAPEPILNSLPEEITKEINSYDWNLNDLLSILCGSLIPNGRIIIATANNIEEIQQNCPQLLRSGRMTPIHFDFGDIPLFCQIVYDYTQIKINPNMLPFGYRFMHASLIEYLISNSRHTVKSILTDIDLFSPESNGCRRSI